MLKKRVIVGTVLVAAVLALLIADNWLSPWFPFLLAAGLAVGLGGCYELLRLVQSAGPRKLACFAGVLILILANWPARVWEGLGDPWHWVLGAYIAVFVGLFLLEAAAYRRPGGTILRLSLNLWIVTYLGLLLCFLIQLRWLPETRGPFALALAIFVPKCGDIGAYFVGRRFGRHKMTPLLSPNKTWEGAGASLGVALLVTLLINAGSLLFASEPVLPWWAATGFGVSIGILAMLGDLMESLIKRDFEQKDASEILPGFGGLLDVLDSVIFSAPAAYLWLAACGS